jgi:hypothetical protein
MGAGTISIETYDSQKGVVTLLGVTSTTYAAAGGGILQQWVSLAAGFNDTAEFTDEEAKEMRQFIEHPTARLDHEPRAVPVDDDPTLK